jgi:hypothetical protein
MPTLLLQRTKLGSVSAPVPVQLDLEGPHSDSDRRAALQILRDAGLDAHASTGNTRGIAETVATVVIVAPLAEFFKTIGSQAGTDATKAIKGLFERLRAAHEGSRSVRLQDVGEGPIVDLDTSLPDDAYRELETLDWSSLGDGDLCWDAAASTWRLVD